MMTNEQLELGFNQKTACGFSRKRESRMVRGQWWFARMREAVANGIDWPVVNQPRAEQVWMPGANRQVKI